MSARCFRPLGKERAEVEARSGEVCSPPELLPLGSVLLIILVELGDEEVAANGGFRYMLFTSC